MYNQSYGYPAYPDIQSGTTDNIQGVRRVSCIEEVYATSVPDGVRAMFMDGTKDMFYIKDGLSVRAFEFAEVAPMKPGDYVTKSEFEELKKQYEQLVQQQQRYAAASAPAVSAQPVADDAGDTGVQRYSGASTPAILPNGVGVGNDQGAA